jgi:N-acetylglucosaminyl-diphospho-decaprenol L-rhamnosyltransferase
VLRTRMKAQSWSRTQPAGTCSDATVDVLIVSFNSAHLLASCARRSCAPKPRACPAPAGRGQRIVGWLRGDLLRTSFPCEVFIQNTQNVGFGRANNQLLEHVRSDHVLLLNTDAFIAPDTIPLSLEYMDAHPRCGILGVRLTDADGSLQPSRRSFPTPVTTFLRRTGLERWIPVPGARLDSEQDHAQEAECDWITGCYYLIRRAVLDEIGLFDPRFFLYCEEVDHCRRARNAGWSVDYLPSTSVVHLGGESAKSVSSLTQERQISALQRRASCCTRASISAWPDSGPTWRWSSWAIASSRARTS